ncbi:hypothetical protein [Tessaracoccus sp. OH4464_COT-324]|uniref:hypothetical protein n=1 Tax=Tessaracoccus sp. OH4464_COT-324 TaxID=2491059 RepID=UPI000F63DE7E|nr:hypothetical protein [Tessaracoccus sp. OH4464_COT-324]RRD46004.1 hypothetical protein EII42_09175 [Tessaracoccus sp. OH4464_COT-324]
MKNGVREIVEKLWETIQRSPSLKPMPGWAPGGEPAPLSTCQGALSTSHKLRDRGSNSANHVESQLLGEESGQATPLALRAAQRLDRDFHGSKSPEVLKMLHQVLIALTNQVQPQCQVVQALATRILN